MINKSIRYFSVEEINRYIKENNYPNDFVEYIKSAPSNIISILSDMGAANSVLNNAQEANYEPIQSTESSLLSDTAESKKTTMEPPDCIVEGASDTKSIEPRKACQNTIKYSGNEVGKETVSEKTNIQNDADIYRNLKFGERISIHRLVLFETTNSMCKEHGIDYQTIRVAMQTKKHEFTIRTKCSLPLKVVIQFAWV